MHMRISWTAHPKHKAADSFLVGRRKIENKSKTEGDIVVDDNNKSETIDQETGNRPIGLIFYSNVCVRVTEFEFFSVAASKHLKI